MYNAETLMRMQVGCRKLNPVPVRVRKLVNKGAITQMFSSASKTDSNRMATHFILRSTNLLIVCRIRKN
jgi:hypothetical protein